MPKVILGQPVDEKKWAEAKRLAAEEGHSEDYAYIMGIYKRMSGLSKAFDPSGLVRVPVTAILDGKPYQTYRWKRPAQPETPKEGGYLLGDNGKPLTLYHGTANDFSKFDKTKIGSATDEGELGAGFYFSTDPQVAQSSPRIVEAKLKISNPLVITFPTWKSDKKKLITQKLHIAEQSSSLGITGVLKLAGHDAVILDYSPVGYNHKEIMVPDADQIEVESNSIQKPKSSMQAEAKKPADTGFKKWFGQSKVVDESGEPLVVMHGSPETGIGVPDPFRAVDFGGGVGESVRLGKLVREAKEKGHDGLIIRNVDDSVDSSRLIGTSYAVFSADQIMPIEQAERIGKSLTFSGWKLQGRRKVHGMDISIENRKGSVRRGKDKDGHAWATKMHADYGYIRGTVGKDKDHLDCYVGPNPESTRVFIVHQNDPTSGRYDEDKVLLGFDTPEEAKALYMKQYDRPGFFGSMDETDIEKFKEKAFADSAKGKKLVIKAIMDGYDRKFYTTYLQMINEKGVYALKDLDGFPDGLDLENCDVIRYGKDRVHYAAGGDWQHPVKFAVAMKGDKLIIAEKFYDTSPQTQSERDASRKIVAEELNLRKAESSGRLITIGELREANKRLAAQIERRYPDELAVGIKVEMEHTDDPYTAKMIAVAHIQENPDYYAKLIAAGLVDEPKAIEEAKKRGLEKSIRLDSPKDSQGPIKITVWALK